MRKLIAERMREMDPEDFGETAADRHPRGRVAAAAARRRARVRAAGSSTWRSSDERRSTICRGSRAAGARAGRSGVRGALWRAGAGAARAAAELLEGEYRRPIAARRSASEPRPDSARRRPSQPSLRERGAELLRQSADVERSDGAHPAYARILEELPPDEARILRLLALEGPQPSVDVRSSQLIGSARSWSPRGSHDRPQAGCRHPERVNAYLNNLNRLGLIWFSQAADRGSDRLPGARGPAGGADAFKATSRAKTVQRSIQLTPFGRDFCEVCLPLERDDQPVPDDIHELGS